MWFRNMMRSNGFGEKELHVGNLDDHYVEVVEEAIMGSSRTRNHENDAPYIGN